MESVNTFELGMSSDSSKMYISNKKYLKAVNFRAVGNLGESNGTLVNIKGNNCEIAFPNIQGVYKLTVHKTFSISTGDFVPGTVTLTINGQTTSQISILESTTTAQVVQYIKLLPNCYNGIYNVSSDFSVAYNDDFIFIYQNTEYNGCNSIDSVDPIVVVNQIIEGSTIYYIDKDENETFIDTHYIDAIASDPLIIIGSTFINKTNYLFTCTKDNINNTGQIWELSYDDSNSLTTLKLLYNNNLNFSKEFTIPPTACTGRYEIPTIQRIYWSDNNNPIRSINVKDPNLMGLDVSLINLSPSIKMSIPTLKLINDTGAVNNIASNRTYQCAYRLIKSNGAITNYSIASNIVNPIAHSTGQYTGTSPNFGSLNGDVNDIPKTILWEISGIDTNYTTIEFIIIIRSGSESGFSIFKYDTQIINGQDTITTLFTNDIDEFEEVSLDEFLIEHSAFTHAKTIEQKDNRLFFANTKSGASEYLESFDTRAFRFKQSTNDVKVKVLDTDTSVQTFTISGNDFSQLPETADLIPAYNLGLSTSDDSGYDQTYKYQRNSTIIGGEGPNIKYKFGSVLIKSDVVPYAPGQSVMGSSLEGSARDVATSQLYPNGYRKAGVITNTTSPIVPNYSNLSPDQTYYINNGKGTMGIEYFNGNFRSYEHNEIYRFAIRFYYKNGNGYFSKWIGDIKFPNYSDSVAPGLEGVTDEGSLCSDFRSMYFDRAGADQAYCNLPYIQFEVDIPTQLSNLISGYEIVRVKREDSDMSITGHGLVNQVVIDAVSPQRYYCPVSYYNTSSDKLSYDNPRNGSTTASAANNGLTFHSFKHIVDKSSSLISQNDKIVITEKYGIINDVALWPLNSVPTGDFRSHWWIRKTYDLKSFVYNGSGTSSSFRVNAAAYADPEPAAGLGVSLSGFGSLNRFKNRDFSDPSTGSACIAVSLLDNISWLTFGSDVVESTTTAADGTSKLLAIHFKPDTLKSQYGGRNLIARTQNEYITCGTYVPVDEANISTINVWGGDIYHGILDIQKNIKELEPSSGVESHSQTWFFPTHSKYNVDLRSGSRVNSDLNDDGGINALYSEEYEYNKALSFENTLYNYIPKPFSFNDTSVYFNRVYWSEVKFNGETNDSWTNIPILNNYDVNGNYGGITSLIALNNNIYFLQERAVGVLLINQQSLMSDQDNQTLNVGISSTLTKHIYNAINVGTQHQWSVYSSNSAITFIDINTNKIYLFNGSELTPISDTKEQRGTLNKLLKGTIIYTDNPVIGKGILVTYDYNNNEFLYTFHTNNTPDVDEKYTLVYSDITNSFTSFYTFTPYIYINNHVLLYSPNDYNDAARFRLYMHNVGGYGSFYGGFYPSSIKIVVNPNSLYTKVFDNISWITESINDVLPNIDDNLDYLTYSDNINYTKDTFGRIRCYNESQNTDWVTLNQTIDTGNLRKTEQTYNIQVPRNLVNLPIGQTDVNIFDPSILTNTIYKDRIRDKYIIIDLEYDNMTNSGQNRFIVHNIKTSFRQSFR